jgi:CheY-like chemotaxis protein
LSKPVPASSSPAEPRSLDGVRVLLVEDTDDTRELLAFALEHCAAVVTTAASALRQVLRGAR